MATGLNDKSGVCALSSTTARISHIFNGRCHNLATVIFYLGDNNKVIKYPNNGNPSVIWCYIQIKFRVSTIDLRINPLKPKD